MNKRPMIRKPSKGTTKSPRKTTNIQVTKEKDKSEEAINKYKEYLEVERNYSNYTVDGYIRDINDFYEYLKMEKLGNLISITHTNVPRYYLSYLSTSLALSKKSIARKLSSLRTFYRFLERSEIIDVNPFDMVETPKADKTLPQVLYPNEIQAIFDSIDTTTSLGKRDRLIVELLYGTGMRVSELCGLKPSDIDYSNNMIKVFGKGHKERYVPMNTHIVEALKAYLEVARPEIMLKKELEDHGFLLVNSHGGPLTTRGVRLIIENIGMNLPEHIKAHPHTFRHTCGSDLLCGGADLRVVQEILGHANLSTTQIYTHVSKEQIKKVYLEHHPRQTQVNEKKK